MRADERALGVEAARPLALADRPRPGPPSPGPSGRRAGRRRTRRRRPGARGRGRTPRSVVSTNETDERNAKRAGRTRSAPELDALDGRVERADLEETVVPPGEDADDGDRDRQGQQDRIARASRPSSPADQAGTSTIAMMAIGPMIGASTNAPIEPMVAMTALVSGLSRWQPLGAARNEPVGRARGPRGQGRRPGDPRRRCRPYAPSSRSPAHPAGRAMRHSVCRMTNTMKNSKVLSIGSEIRPCWDRGLQVVAGLLERRHQEVGAGAGHAAEDDGRGRRRDDRADDAGRRPATQTGNSRAFAPPSPRRADATRRDHERTITRAVRRARGRSGWRSRRTVRGPSRRVLPTTVEK